MKTLFQLSEATKADQHHVTAFIRGNPPTTGHMQLIDKIHSVAKENSADHSVVVSHSQDPKKNPLSSDQKKKHFKRFSPETNVVASSKEHPTILHHLAALHKAGVTHLHLVAGSDRHAEFEKLVNSYNGKKAGHGYYKFKKITIHSAGERDPDAEGTSGISATKQREHAASGNFKEFRKGVPDQVSDAHAKDLMNDVKNGQKTKKTKKTKKNEESEMESLDNLFEQFMIEDSQSFSDEEIWNVVSGMHSHELDPNENDIEFIDILMGESYEEDIDESRVLSIAQRQRARMKFKSRQPRLKRMREIKRKRMATPQRLQYRARTSALMMLRKRIAGAKGLAYHKLSPSQRYTIDKAVQQRFGKNLDKLVGTISKRTLPMIRKKEMARLAKARGQKTSSIIGRQVITQSYDMSEEPDYISTNKDHLLTPKVNMLLRLGLVDQDEIERYRRALKIGEKALSSPELRSKILSMLDKTLKLATDDPQTFARIRAMVVLRKNSQNEQNSLEVDPLEIDPLEIDKMDLTPDQGHSQHLNLRKKMIRQHESKTFESLREKMKYSYDPLAEDKIVESLYKKSMKYNISIDTIVEVYNNALKDSGNENIAFDTVNSFLANQELDEIESADKRQIIYKKPPKRDGSAAGWGWRSIPREIEIKDPNTKQMGEGAFSSGKLKPTEKFKKEAEKIPSTGIFMGRDDKGTYTANTVNHIEVSRTYDTKEEVEQMDESHFKVGDKVKFKTSGMKGEVIKLDKEDGAEDEKYYTIKGEDGKMRKMAPQDMIKEAVRAAVVSNDNDKMYIFIAPKGSPDSEPERNKAAAGLRKDRRPTSAPTGKQHYDVRRIPEEADTDSIFEIEMYVPEIHEARGDHLLTIEGGRGKGRKFMHKDTSTDDHLSAMEFHLKGYHAAKKDKKAATEKHHAKMYHKHKDQIEALGGVGNHLRESARDRLVDKIRKMAAAKDVRERMNADALARLKAEQEKAEKEKKQGVSEEGGAGEFGTSELTKKYAKDTPGQCQEILNMNTADMGDVIKDFKDSDAPQFKGKSKDKRREMAIAAKLNLQNKG